MTMLKKASTNVVRYFMVRLTADGKAATGLTITTFDLQYTRELTASATKIDAIVGTGGAATHVDNKVFELDSTSSPGLYMVCFPDAAFATGVDQVTLALKHDSTVFTEAQNIQLVDYDPFDSVRMGMTALPNAAADAAGGLPISDDGGLDIDEIKVSTDRLTAVRAAVLTDWINGQRLDVLLDTIPTTAMRGTDGANTTTPPTAAENVNEWEAQSQADPTGFHINAKEWNDAAITTALETSADIADAVADEVITGSEHNITNSLARRIRLLSEVGNYAMGLVWLDTNAANTGDVSFEDGTEVNPTSLVASVNTLLAAIPLHGCHVAANSSVTLVVAQENQEWAGANWTLALGGQSIAGSSIIDATISGISTGVPGAVRDCFLNACTFAGGDFIQCALADTITLSGIEYHFFNCHHAEMAAPSTIDFGAAVGATEVHVHDWHGNLTILNMKAGDVLHFTCSDGALTMDATCTAGTRNSFGNFAIVDNSSGMTVNDDNVYDRIGAPVGASISADLAALNDLSDADILTQVNIALNAAIPELSVGAPSNTPSLRNAVMFRYMALLNSHTTSGSLDRVRNAAGTVIAEATVSDDLVTFESEKYISG